MEDIKILINDIERGKLLSEGVFKEIDLDSILEIRDSDPFDSEWISCYDEIKEIIEKTPLSNEQHALVDELRKAAFIAASKATGQHEIASYISDDFELISSAIFSGFSNEILSRLLKSYKSGVLPC